jgi:endogenous inhibitor of DNA gyrase (YacG/DUF329 family)
MFTRNPSRHEAKVDPAVLKSASPSASLWSRSHAVQLDPRPRAFYLFDVVRITCPTCKRVVDGPPEPRPYRPFCSERCRAVDLGSWLDAAYRISAPVSEEDLDSGLPTEGDPPPDQHEPSSSN